MVSMRVSILAIAMVSVFSLNAAQLRITNTGTSTIRVNPKWESRKGCYDTLAPSKYADYDSGFDNITSIEWMEIMPSSSIYPDQLLVRIYSTDNAVKLGFANLGANFEIGNGGSYWQKFGPADGGWHGGTATPLMPNK